MNPKIVFELGEKNCPGRSGDWCHINGTEPCEPERCPFIYWFKMWTKASRIEQTGKET